MSSLLKEAIIDAKALREAALKNAEHAVINKYSNEVRNTLNTLLIITQLLILRFRLKRRLKIQQGILMPPVQTKPLMKT